MSHVEQGINAKTRGVHYSRVLGSSCTQRRGGHPRQPVRPVFYIVFRGRIQQQQLGITWLTVWLLIWLVFREWGCRGLTAGSQQSIYPVVLSEGSNQPLPSGELYPCAHDPSLPGGEGSSGISQRPWADLFTVTVLFVSGVLRVATVIFEVHHGKLSLGCKCLLTVTTMCTVLLLTVMAEDLLPGPLQPSALLEL